MAVTKKPMVESRESSAETPVQWARRRPAMAALVLVGALAVVVVLVWYTTSGRNTGPKEIHRSPWEHRKAPGGGTSPVRPAGK